MTTVRVTTASKKYAVHIGRALLAQCGEQIQMICGGSKAMLVTDDVVNTLYADKVESSLESAG